MPETNDLGPDRLRTADSVVRGMLWMPEGQTGFAEGILVVSSCEPESPRLRVKRFEGDCVVGQFLSEDEWSNFVVTEEGLDWPASEGTPSVETGATVWIFRSSFIRRDRALRRLLADGALLSALHRLETPDCFFGVVDGVRGAEFRRSWEAEARDDAIEHLRKGELKEGLREAKLSHAVAASFTPDSIAIWSLAESMQDGDKAEAKAGGVLAYAERSLGVDLRARAEALRTEYRRLVRRRGPVVSRPAPRYAALNRILPRGSRKPMRLTG